MYILHVYVECLNTFQIVSLIIYHYIFIQYVIYLIIVESIQLGMENSVEIRCFIKTTLHTFILLMQFIMNIQVSKVSMDNS